MHSCTKCRRDKITLKQCGNHCSTIPTWMVDEWIRGVRLVLKKFLKFTISGLVGDVKEVLSSHKVFGKEVVGPSSEKQGIP